MRRARAEGARRGRYDNWCGKRAADRVAELPERERYRLVDERLPAFKNKQRFYLQLSSWSEERKREWLTQQILKEYGREEEPSYEEWCQQFDNPPLR